MVKGVFFDVGGTLYTYRNVQSTFQLVLEQMAQKLELNRDMAEVAAHYRAANKEADLALSTKSFYLFRDHVKSTFRNFLDRIDKGHLHHHADWFEEIHTERMVDCMKLMPDCHDTLTALKGRGLYLSAVSNADANHLKPLIERGELHRWLNDWTCSEDAQSCKPDRRFFEIALKKSGLDANQVLFVGDSLEQDITGAHAMGMRTALITELDQLAPFETGRKSPDPDYRIRSLSELPGILDKIA
jgi:HAD superfamily hydrolase (TIGR01509 family)